MHHLPPTLDLKVYLFLQVRLAIKVTCAKFQINLAKFKPPTRGLNFMTFHGFLIDLSPGGAVHKVTFFDLRNRLALFVLHLLKKVVQIPSQDLEI